MERDFCLYCGQAVAYDVAGQPLPCTCPITPDLRRDLESRETQHWQEYRRAEPLVPWQMSMQVLTEKGPLTVWQLLGEIQHPDLIKEHAVLCTREGLVQLIYQRFVGSRLIKWPFR